MKVHKEKIRLSPDHPSLLLNLRSCEKIEKEPFIFAPVVIDQHGTLVDGYRRYQLTDDVEVDVVQREVTNLFEAAFDLNRNTRAWDPVDQFLWSRWASSLHVATDRVSSNFPDILKHAPNPVLEALAQRKLQLRQAQLILDAPAKYQSFLLELLTQTIHLNINETATLIEMGCDLVSVLNKRTIPDVFSGTPLAEILQNPSLSPRQKGESLLKVMRILRYPEYHKKVEAFSVLWRQLGLEPSIRIKKAQFLERGILEMTLTSGSLDEMKEKVHAFSRSLDSPIWDKIWEDS